MHIPYAKHEMLPEDIEAVTAVLQSGALTNGPEISNFEKDFSEAIDAPYAVAVSSGTAALHLAVHALGIEASKKVILPSLTFAATANAVIYCGGVPDFVDIDPYTLLLDTDQVAEKVEANPDGYAGVIGVDFAGYPMNSREISEICKEHGLWLVEDAAHALGAMANYGSEVITVGSARYSDATIFSLHPAKHITTGEGGVITTANPDLRDHLKLLRSHSMDRATDRSVSEPWFYELREVGFNYRMSDINAALGRSQLARLTGNIAARQNLAAIYREALEGTNVNMPQYDDNHTHAYHLFIVQVPGRRDVYTGLRDEDIYPQVHYVPLHMQPAYQEASSDTALPNTERYYSECLSIPMYPSLTAEEQHHVIDTLIRLTDS